MMKNIQVIDGARNCTFSIFQATDDEFLLIFPDPGQDIQYAEDLYLPCDEDGMPLQSALVDALKHLWERPIRKQDAMGIHGTLFYQMEHLKKWYQAKREDAIGGGSVNQARRRLFGIKYP